MEKKLKLLYAWLESWHQGDGYGGFLHHAIHGTVNWYHAILVPSYTYEPLINGFINLYNRTSNKIWLDKAETAAQEIIRIIDDAYQFSYSGFEFAPKGGSVVHTVNPLFSLMKLYEITNKRIYLEITKKVLKSVISIYWRGDNIAGPFNMSLMVAAAFAEYGRVSNDWRLHKLYGEKCFDIVKKHKVGSEGGEAEGLYYRNENNHSIIFPWYNTVKAIAMLRYGRAINDVYWEQEGISLLLKLKKILSKKITYPHSFQYTGESFEKYNDVELIAPVSLAITWMSNEGILNDVETIKAMSEIMRNQTSIGFVYSNQGYDWRSLIGVTAWNCFVFEMLTTQYSIDNINPVEIPEYMAKWENIEIFENKQTLRISKDGIIFIEICKFSGEIKHFNIMNYDFKINEMFIPYRPHIVRMSNQRHSSVAYIDNNGNGMWLEVNDGKLAIWSPFNDLDIYINYQIINRGVLRYSKFSPLMTFLLRPLIYNKNVMNFIGQKLKNRE